MIFLFTDPLEHADEHANASSFADPKLPRTACRISKQTGVATAEVVAALAPAAAAEAGTVEVTTVTTQKGLSLGRPFGVRETTWCRRWSLCSGRGSAS